MIVPLAEIVEFDKLLDVVWVSALAGVGVTAVYSVALAGATLFAEARREGRSGGAVALAIVTAVAGAAFVAAVVFGVIVMTQK